MAAPHGVRGALLPDGFKPSKRSAPRGERRIKSLIFSRLGQNLCGQPSASPPLWPLQFHAAFTVHFGHTSKYPAF